MGDAFALAQERLGPGRIHHCMRWVGVCRRAFDAMCERAVSKSVHGSLLSEKQTIQNWVADSAAAMEAARLLTLKAAWTIDQVGAWCARTEIAMIKYFGATVMHDVLDRALQIHGSLGYSTDMPIEEMYRWARAARLYDGPDEVHRVTVARRILRDYEPRDAADRARPDRAAAAHGEVRRPARRAVEPGARLTADTLLIDFGGVLTTNVFESFGEFCVAEGLDRQRFADLVRGDPAAQRLLVDVETGVLAENDFERALAPLLGEFVSGERLIDRLTAALRPDQPMLDAMRDLRAGGVTTVLVSNSLGMGAYDGYALERLFTHIVLSAAVGLRKPSRRIYHHALELAAATPERAVFVDDLAQNVVAAERLGLRGILHTEAATTIPLLAEAFAVELEVP